MAVSIHGNNGVTTTNGSDAAPSLAAPDNDTGLYFGTNLIHATTGGSERLRIDNDNVNIIASDLIFEGNGHKISTGSSSHLLSIQGGPTNMGGLIELRGGSDTGDIRFFAQGATATKEERLRIASDGDIHIGANGSTRPSQTVSGFTVETNGKNVRWSNGGGTSGTTASNLTIYGGGSSTNVMATTSWGTNISLHNTNNTNGNSNCISFCGSTELATSFVIGENTSHSGRTGELVFATSSGSAPLERLRITSAGLVGINCTPNKQLEVKGTDVAFRLLSTVATGRIGMEFYDTSAQKGYFGYPSSSNDELSIQQNEDADFWFYIGGGEKLRITTAGKIGIGHHSTSQVDNGKELSIRPANGGGIRLIRPGDTIANPNTHLDLTTTTSGSAFPSGEAYTVKYKTYNSDQIFETYHGGGTGGNISFRTKSSSNESLRITSGGIIKCGTSATLKAEINNAVSGHQFISQCDDNNNGFEIYQQHGSTTTRNTLAVYNNTPGSKHLNFSVRGDNTVLISGNKDTIGLVMDGTSAGTAYGETGNTIDFSMLNEVNQFTGNPAARIASYLQRGNNGFGLKFYARHSGGTFFNSLDLNADYQVLPGVDGVQDLGSDSKRWRRSYVRSAYPDMQTLAVTGSSFSNQGWYDTGFRRDSMGGLDLNGTYIVIAFADTHAAGGGNYSCNYTWIVGMRDQSTNQNASNDVPLLSVTGHSTNGQVLALRTTRQGSSHGGSEWIQWKASQNWSALDNSSSGRILRFTVQRIGRSF